MADVNLQLGSIKLDGGVWSLGNYSIGGSDKGASVSVAADKPLVQGLGAYGTLRTDADGDNLTLVGGSDLNGAVTIGGAAAASISAINFGGAAVSVSLGSDFVKLTNVKMGGSADTVNVSLGNKDFNLNTGAGNDMVIIETVDASSKIDLDAGNDVVSVTGATGEVVLGAGKDTVKFGDSATVNLTDYNFADDVIELADAVLTNDGKVQDATAASVVSGLTATNGVFLARTTDGSKTTVLATAEKDTTKAVINASSIKENEVVIIDATSADSANITLGKASVVAVSLNSAKDAGVDTITIGDTKAKASITVTKFFNDDVLNFTGLTFDKTTIGNDSTNVTLGSGNISLNLGTDASLTTGGAKFNLNGTTLYATTDDNQNLVLTDETDLSKVLVKGQLGASFVSGIVTSAKLVNLDAVNINNIDMVSLTADAVAGTSLIGTKNKDNGVTLDASAASDGVAIWTNNSEKKIDIIKLNSAAEAADTLWFGTTDYHDSVTGFQLASDILYLHDANAMTADKGVITVGKASLDVTGGLVGTEEIMQVQGAKFAGTVYAAGDFASDANDVINLGANAGKVNYYAVAKDAKVSVASSEAINYTFLKDIDYAGATKANIAANGSVASINASDVDSTDSKIIIEGVANVSLGAGTNEVWVNGAAKDATVVLSTANEGTDKVWFGASDKNVTVTGFNTESDVIALMGSIGEFSAKMDETSSDVVISNASKKALTLSGVRENVSLVDAAGAKYKLFVNDAIYTTNTDGTNIYLAGNLTAGSDVTAATNIVVEGANNKWGIASSAIVGESVKTIDMSASSADFVLIGSANAANTITGGTGTNYLNGGGASKDVLNGVTGAVDNFYYGKEDGNDTIVNIGAEDIVQLYDVASADLVNVSVKEDKTVITLNNDRKLTINNSIADGATFVLTDGTYVFDSSVEGNWVQK